MVVGAPLEDSNAVGPNGNQTNNQSSSSGAVYVFRRSGNLWMQEAYLKASNTGVQDMFGSSVSISGDTLVVGAFGEQSSATGVDGDQNDNSAPFAGAAYVFVRTGTNWTQQAYLKGSNTEADDFFGQSVAISGDTVVVGAPEESSDATGVNGAPDNNRALNSGAAYVFVRSGTNWTQQAYLKASNTGPAVDGNNDAFGNSVAISGDKIVVGAYHEDSGARGPNANQLDNSSIDAGAAYVFQRNGTNWSQSVYLKASNPDSGYPYGDEFGWAVAIDGDIVIVGARYEGSNATGVNGEQANHADFLSSGAAYVFVREGNAWFQQAYLKAPNTGAYDFFGWSVAIAGNRIAVGAAGEDSNAGLNGNQQNNDALSAGAVYTFTRTGTNWYLLEYLKASNAGSDDQMGFSIAISEQNVVSGACFESSRSVGIDGDQTNDDSFWSGAVYVFGYAMPSPRLLITPNAQSGFVLRLDDDKAGTTWSLQRSSNIAGPWSTNIPMNVVVPGSFELHDANASPGQTFYRAVRD
jgi:hypothetical protein